MSWWCWDKGDECNYTIIFCDVVVVMVASVTVAANRIARIYGAGRAR